MKNLYLLRPSLLLLLCAFLACQNPSSNSGIKKDAKLGDVTLSVTGAESAQEHFKNGLLFLHSFEYFDARAEFLKAQEIDKEFAMAYWGELMAYNHSIWQRQLTDRAKSTLRKMGPTKEVRLKMAKTDIEREFLIAVEALYGKGSREDRDNAYTKQMGEMVKKFPNNHEVQSFYALSLLASSKNGRDEALFDKSAQIAKGILEENNNHPGALHYLIHSYDDPDHAHLAVDAADSYAKVAPDAAHALHMPSHIYVALGRWNDVVNSNIASWNASMKKKDKGQSMEGSYHALNWLQYGLLQRGEVELATQLLWDMKKYAETTPSKSARSYLMAMKGAHMVETNTWDGEVADIQIKTDDLSLAKQTQHVFLEGMKAFYKKDKNRLTEILTNLKKEKYTASLNVGNEKLAMCSSGEYSNVAPSQLDIDMVTIVEMELEAYLSHLNGDQKKAIETFNAAAELDEKLKYAFGPPIILKPAHEACAEFLMEQDQYESAFDMYTRSLNRHPKRLHSTKGKLVVAEKLNKANDISALKDELKVILENKPRDEIKRS